MRRELTYATVCSGIECCSVACRGFPLRPVFFSEIEPFPCAVLKAHYPDVPNLGDMSKISVTNKTEITNGTVRIVLDRPIDILAGGTPCQDVSVAGQRAGMQEGSGTRSSLAFEFVRLVRELAPRYVLWENVAGCIDSKNAPDFLRFANAIGECGYSVAWRVLDAQYVRVDGMERAVPQRRRRVWLVGCAGADVARAAGILFEPDCVAGHTAPRRRTGEGFAYSLAGRDRVDAGLVGEAKSYGLGHGGQGGAVTPVCEVQPALLSGDYKGPLPGVVQCYDMTHADDPGRKVADGVSPTLQSRMGTGGNQVSLVVSTQGLDGYNQQMTGECAPTLRLCKSDADHVPCIISTNSSRDDEPLGIGRDVFNSGANASYFPDIRVGVQPTLTARTTQGAVCARLKGDE